MEKTIEEIAKVILESDSATEIAKMHFTYKYVIYFFDIAWRTTVLAIMGIGGYICYKYFKKGIENMPDEDKK